MQRSYAAFVDSCISENILEKIPDDPHIPIKNYLLDLIDDNDGIEKSIYLNDASGIIQEIWEEIIQKNWRKLNVRKFIPENFRVTPSSFYAYKNSRKNISISTMYKLIKIWQEFCNKSEEESIRKWDDIFNKELLLSTRSKCQKTSLPRYIDPKLSYLLGWICGDGNLQESGNHYLVKISEKSREQLEIILRPLFVDVFGVFPPIFLRYGNGYAIQIGSKSILRFLQKVMKIKVGQIPKIVDDFDPVNKKYFLMGLFDAEGYVNTTYSDSAIIISQSSKFFLETVIELFRNINISFTGPQYHKTDLGIWYTIKIRKKLEILKFIHEIGSCHVDKAKRLRILRDIIEKNWNS